MGRQKETEARPDKQRSQFKKKRKSIEKEVRRQFEGIAKEFKRQVWKEVSTEGTSKQQERKLCLTKPDTNKAC